MSKPEKAAVGPWRSALGAYQDGAIEVVADGLKLHWAKLQVPDRSYEADFAWIQVRRGAVTLFFGKEDLDSVDTLRTRLEIRYPAEKFLQHFWKNSRDFHQTLRGLPAWPADAARDDCSPERMRAAKDQLRGCQLRVHGSLRVRVRDGLLLPPAQRNSPTRSGHGRCGTSGRSRGSRTADDTGIAAVARSGGADRGRTEGAPARGASQ